jgi:ketosteroid isomerase-like protein
LEDDMAKAVSSDLRTELASVPRSYFAAVDRLDVDDVLTHFADDATLTVQTDGVTFTGADEIRRMFTDFLGSWDSMVHDITNLVVDEVDRRAATEQRVTLTKGGTDTPMYNCNFFSIGEDGRFDRVIIWMDGSNPLK